MKTIIIILSLLISGVCNASFLNHSVNCSNVQTIEKNPKSKQAKIEIAVRIIGKYQITAIEFKINEIIRYKFDGRLNSIEPESHEYTSPINSIVFDVGPPQAWGNSELNLPPEVFASLTESPSSESKFKADLVDWHVDSDYFEFVYPLDCKISKGSRELPVSQTRF